MDHPQIGYEGWPEVCRGEVWAKTRRIRRKLDGIRRNSSLGKTLAWGEACVRTADSIQHRRRCPSEGDHGNCLRPPQQEYSCIPTEIDCSGLHRSRATSQVQ